MRFVDPPSYVEVLSELYPNLRVTAVGDGTDYDTLKCDSILPSKDALDLAIIEKTKERMWRAIQAERDRRRYGGVKIGEHWFHSDDTSRIQQLGLLLFGASIPANLMWKTLSGGFVLMTPTLAQQIFGGIAMSDQGVFTVAEQHKAQMMNHPNPSTYDYFLSTPSWPKIFGEE